MTEPEALLAFELAEMFGIPVYRLMAEMPAAEFRAWAMYRRKRGFALREMHMLLARLTHGFYAANRAKNSAEPQLADFYAPLAAAREDEVKSSRYTAAELQSLKVLMGES